MKIQIKTKEESRNAINRLGLNTVPEIFIEKHETDKMRQFMDTYKEELYVLRDADRSSSHYEYISSYEECVEKAKHFKGRVILAVSINTYKEKLLLGAIEIKGDVVRLCATENKALDHRTMYGGAEYNFETDIFDKNLSKIPELDFLYGYIVEHQLFDITVEFTIYDKCVGTKNERIIINEIRNY
ncbi:MAG: hypothetical protein J6A53_09535 [Clostridia bacterium]|nr:hypothetical protein [Clostridia bacterium]MBO5440882.1 hypothetical protein [Clostridia bacterium]